MNFPNNLNKTKPMKIYIAQNKLKLVKKTAQDKNLDDKAGSRQNSLLGGPSPAETYQHS